MLNQMVLVGRIIEDPVLEKNETNVSITTFTLAIPRRSDDEECDTDFIPITLYGGVAENTVEYCKKGDLVGIKGRIACLDEKIRLVAEKVTFLAGTSK